MEDSYQIIIKKLDSFIRRYYLNKIIKGLILSLSVYLFWYLSLVVLEYFGRFSVNVRTCVFVISVITLVIVFIKMILLPLLNLLRIGKVLSYKDAAKIIGNHFPEISDKLVNTLELKELAGNEKALNDIVIASINQRTLKLSPIPFVSAIDFKKNLKYLRVLIPILLLLLLLFGLWPHIFSEATERIINYNKYYETPPPFAFDLLTDSLQVRKGDDLDLQVKVSGKFIPDNVSINFGSNKFYMDKTSNNTFTYRFKNLNNDLNFNFSALDINSQTYTVKVLPAPIIVNFKAVVKPPAYTKMESVTYTNAGDFQLPVGTDVFWEFNTSNLEKLSATFDSVEVQGIKNENIFSLKKRILKSCNYKLTVQNQHFNESLGIDYQINVIPDLYPSITVKSAVDSLQLSIMYFKGFIDDDYGFSALNFVCKPNKESDSIVRIPIQFAKSVNSQDFYYAFDFASIDIKGNSISYYIEVFDNDGINGAKRSISEVQEYVIPTAKDLENATDEVNKDTEVKINEAKETSSRLKDKIDDLKEKLISQNLSSWEKNQMMQQIVDDQQKLDDLMTQIKQEQNSLMQQKQQYSKDYEMLQKQKEINDLLNNLMDEEMRKLMEEMQKLAENFNKDDFFKKADDIKFSYEELDKQMENTLEMLKKAEVSEKLNNVIDKLNDLADEHNKLSEETGDKKSSLEELQQKQEEHRKEFEEVKKDFENAMQKNSELKAPIKIDDFKDEIGKINENFDKSEQELKDDKKSKASKSQKENSKQMQQLADNMQSMLDTDMESKMGEDMDGMRQIIENLILFSFEQEDVLVGQKKLDHRDPRFKDYFVKQKNTKDNFKVIKDSISTLAARIPQVGPLLNNEVREIHKNLDFIIAESGSNRRYRIEVSQQKVMTSANNLALLLLELMEQMQAQMSESKSGGKSNKSCKKPGQDGMGEMGDLKKAMKNQMQDMIEQMKSGGQDKSGKRSEKLAKMLKQQEMAQQMINNLSNSGVNPEASKQLNQINKMIEENIKDIISDKITEATINRQEQILTRLLKAENSDREREIDNKRKSNEAKNYKLSNPSDAFDKKQEEIRFNELLQMSNIKLNTYYNTRYKEYLKRLGEK